MKLKLLLVLFLFTPFFALADKISVVIYVDDGYRPYSYQEQGQTKGIYIDVLQAAFAKMTDFDVKLEPVPWNRGKKMMEQGKGLGLTPAFFHGGDWPYLYPYSLAFHTETIIAICSKTILSTHREKWPDNYKNLHIGNVAGFDGWGGDRFRTMVKEGEIEYQEAHTSQALILMLVNGRVDCIMMEERAFDYEFKHIKQSGKYRELVHVELQKGAIVGTDPVYIGYSEPAFKSGQFPYAYEFKKAFDITIYNMIKSGEIAKIIADYQTDSPLD